MSIDPGSGSSMPGASSKARPKILVIDDDPSLLATLQSVLEDFGYEVVTAPEGSAGLAAYRSTRPAVVLTDIIMPKTDGIELIRQIRREDSKVGIIAMSGGSRTSNSDFVAIAQTLGADAGIYKPFDGDAIHAILVELLRHEYVVGAVGA